MIGRDFFNFNIMIKLIISITLFFWFFLLSVPFIHAKQINITKSDIYWLTQNIYHEARSESIAGQIMVGIVTLSRLESKRWGTTIKSVVTAPNQFSWYHKGNILIPQNKKEWNKIKNVAFYSILLYSLFQHHDIMFYHNHDIIPNWSNKMCRVFVIGNHTFYIERRKS